MVMVVVMVVMVVMVVAMSSPPYCLLMTKRTSQQANSKSSQPGDNQHGQTGRHQMMITSIGIILTS